MNSNQVVDLVLSSAEYLRDMLIQCGADQQIAKLINTVVSRHSKRTASTTSFTSICIVCVTQRKKPGSLIIHHQLQNHERTLRIKAIQRY